MGRQVVFQWVYKIKSLCRDYNLFFGGLGVPALFSVLFSLYSGIVCGGKIVKIALQIMHQVFLDSKQCISGFTIELYSFQHNQTGKYLKGMVKACVFKTGYCKYRLLKQRQL